MSTFKIDFEWKLVPKGFDHLPAGPGKALRAGVSASSESGLSERTERLVPRSDRLSPAYRPLDRYPDLYARFAKVDTVPNLENFMTNFGPLTEAGFDPDRGEDVRNVLRTATAMRQVIEHKRPERVRLTTVPVILATDKDKRLRLTLLPMDLREALWLQLARDYEAGRRARFCRHCGIPIRVGVGTGRRLDADFCCDKHRSAHNNDLRRGREE